MGNFRKGEYSEGQGYDGDRFVDPIDDDLYCSICQGVLRDPLKTPCEHYFCRACMLNWLRNAKTCPTDAAYITLEVLTGPDRFVRKLLGSRRLHCENSPECDAIVTLDDLAAHEEKCIKRPVKCGNESCNVVKRFDEIENHEKYFCEYRKIVCERCRAEVPVHLIVQHETLCARQLSAVAKKSPETGLSESSMNNFVKEVFARFSSIEENLQQLYDRVLLAGDQNKSAFKSIEPPVVSDSIPTMESRNASSNGIFSFGMMLVTLVGNIAGYTVKFFLIGLGFNILLNTYWKLMEQDEENFFH